MYLEVAVLDAGTFEIILLSRYLLTSSKFCDLYAGDDSLNSSYITKSLDYAPVWSPPPYYSGLRL